MFVLIGFVNFVKVLIYKVGESEGLFSGLLVCMLVEGGYVVMFLLRVERVGLIMLSVRV